ncbi:hypothetical protein JT05_03755 [Desulfosporosinus sp. Tol-M]|jgi:hypothetical protein|nr:hypothetical protein JT05_03755 [Desulfosporosinus sp. Tol-M]
MALLFNKTKGIRRRPFSIAGHGVGAGITAIFILACIAMLYNLQGGNSIKRVRKNKTTPDDWGSRRQETRFVGSNRILWERIKNDKGH